VVEFVALDEDYDVPGEGAGPEAQLAAKQQLRAARCGAQTACRPTIVRFCCLREVEDMSYSEIGARLASTKARSSRGWRAHARQ